MFGRWTRQNGPRPGTGFALSLDCR
jgi:hypothetical protein